MPQLSIEGQKIVEKEKKRRKKISGMYDIAEDEKENADNSDKEAEEEEKLSADDEAAVIPYVPILQRGMDEMNHAEAELECSESLMLMFDHVRQQTQQIQDLLCIEE